MAVGARGLVGVVVASVALTPAAARGATVIEAQTVWHYDMSSYTLVQGDALTFRNADSASPGPHNVTSNDKGADGKPLFASETVPNGKEVPVTGAQQLKAGSYSFFCTVHPFMTASLTVTAPAAPPPPPSSGGDTRAPSLRAALEKTSLSSFLKAKRISARIASDEKASLSMRLTATIGSHVYTLATARTSAAPGSARTVVLKSSKSRLRPLRGARRAKLTLAVEGRDDAGNVGTTQARRTLSR